MKSVCHYGPTNSYILSSPLGDIEIVCCQSGLHSLKMKGGVPFPDYNIPVKSCITKNETLSKTAEWLQNYFRFPTKIRSCEIPPICAALLPEKGTFPDRIWTTMAKEVPFGQTISYGKLAEMSGSVGASRAVGNLMKSNEIPIILPCHRVVKSDGTIGNYSGGKFTKEWLLQHEKEMKC